jgi:hypothetical protein
VGLSGFLYLAIVVGWAVYLVPFALKRYDEATRNRSIDRFSSAMRVLGSEDGERVPSGHADANPGAPPEAAPASPAPPGPGREAQRTAARVAARRRRRVLVTLLLATAGTGAAAALAYLPSWSATVTGTLLVLWLVVCRSQARREYATRAPYRTERPARPPVREEPARFDAAAAVETEPEERHAGVPPSAAVADPGEADVVEVAPNEMPADDEPTVVIAREDMPEGEERQFAGSGSLWDPVPVTLPTYVHKPRAPRTIRTIDLGAEEARSPRRSEESAIYTHRTHTVEQPGSEQQESGETPEARQESGPTRRAVGE